MKIDGRLLAQEIYDQLALEVAELNISGIIPHLVVILFGNDPNSLSYIKQKQKGAEKIGAKLTFIHESTVPTQEAAENIVQKYAQDPMVHALIIQRPIPLPLDTEKLTRLNPLAKDVDGFLPNSPYLPPVGLAVVKILEKTYSIKVGRVSPYRRLPDKQFILWTDTKNVLLVGRGETGGKPIAATLTKYGIKYTQVHSQTPYKDELYQNADIIISTIGKSGVIPQHFLKKGVILVGVGLHEENGKLVGDYDDLEAERLAAFFTPTPGGTGPVNVACLMDNVVAAAKLARG